MRKLRIRMFGPYEGSDQNGGRPIYVFKKKKNGKTVTTSSNKARVEYKERTGKKLRRNQEVDHKDNKGRAGSDKASNLQVISKKKNVGKENKRRAKKAVKKKP